MSTFAPVFNRCEHPRVIKNKYTNEYVYVECGVCPHCLVKRSDFKRNLCEYERFNKKYCYFVTLTYNSHYVPKMALESIDTYLPEPMPGSRYFFRSILFARMLMDDRVSKVDPDFISAKVNARYLDEHLRILEYEKKQQQSIRIPVYIGKKRPYILRTIPRRAGLQRFRDEYVEELVWLDSVLAEKLKKKSQCDGMTGAFPQYRGLLKYINYRDYQLFAKRLRKFFYQKTKEYEKISSYVVSEYTPNTFRPHFHILFFFDSDRLAENFRQGVFESWRLGRIDVQLARADASSYLAGYVNSIVSLPSIFKHVKFAKVRSRFSSLFGFDSYRKEIETTFEGVDRGFAGLNYISNGRSLPFFPPGSFKRKLYPKFVSFSSDFHFENTRLFRAVAEVLRLFRRNEPFEVETPRNICRFIYYYVNYLYKKMGYSYDTLPECLRLYLHYSRVAKSILFYTKQLESKLSRLLYVWRNFVCIRGSDDYKFRVIEYYYSRSNYNSLVRQLSLQVDLFNQMEYSDELLSLFYVKPGKQNIKHSKIDEWNEYNYKEVHYFRLKHKVQNDANQVFCEEL